MLSKLGQVVKEWTPDCKQQNKVETQCTRTFFTFSARVYLGEMSPSYSRNDPCAPDKNLVIPTTPPKHTPCELSLVRRCHTTTHRSTFHELSFGTWFVPLIRRGGIREMPLSFVAHSHLVHSCPSSPLQGLPEPCHSAVGRCSSTFRALCCPQRDGLIATLRRVYGLVRPSSFFSFFFFLLSQILRWLGKKKRKNIKLPLLAHTKYVPCVKETARRSIASGGYLLTSRYKFLGMF